MEPRGARTLNLVFTHIDKCRRRDSTGRKVVHHLGHLSVVHASLFNLTSLQGEQDTTVIIVTQPEIPCIKRLWPLPASVGKNVQDHH